MVRPEIVELGEGLSTVRYVKQPCSKINGCVCCVAVDDDELCGRLPNDCLKEPIIYVAAPEEEPPKLDWDKE